MNELNELMRVMNELNELVKVMNELKVDPSEDLPNPSYDHQLDTTTCSN